MRLLRTAAIVYAAAFLLPGGAAAQTPAQTPAPTPTPSETRAQPAEQQQQRDGASVATPEEADLSITARVTARELLFRKVPNPRVEFPGRPERRTLWEAERENLPEQVQSGVTYRDIGIRLRITSVFADIDRIVAEALGEVPSATPRLRSHRRNRSNHLPPCPRAGRSPDEARPRARPIAHATDFPRQRPLPTQRSAARPRGARRGREIEDTTTASPAPVSCRCPPPCAPSRRPRLHRTDAAASVTPTPGASAAASPETRTSADEDFELNIGERRITEENFEASTEVEVGDGGAGSVNLRVGVAASAERIDVLLRNVRGRVRFRASLDDVLRRLGLQRRADAPTLPPPP